LAERIAKREPDGFRTFLARGRRSQFALADDPQGDTRQRISIQTNVEMIGAGLLHAALQGLDHVLRRKPYRSRGHIDVHLAFIGRLGRRFRLVDQGHREPVRSVVFRRETKAQHEGKRKAGREVLGDNGVERPEDVEFALVFDGRIAEGGY